jgi:DNA-binding beta-propeller fold protein YncE
MNMPKKYLPIVGLFFLLAGLTGLSTSGLAGAENYHFVTAWGEEGAGQGQFTNPIGIALTDREIFVSDTGNNRIQVFSLNGESLQTFGSSGSGPARFDAPGGVAVDGNDRLYVADFYNQRIQVLAGDGSFISQYGETGELSIRAGRFNYPTDVAVLADNSLVVADAYNDRIQVFGPDGKFIRKWGGLFGMNISGSRPGWFKTATGVTVGPENNIFVADFYNHRIQKFTSDGSFMTTFGIEGDKPGQLKLPSDMAVDKNGNVYVVDFGNNRIQKFSPN